MVSTEVDDTWAQLRATRGGESAGNGKPVPPRFCGRPEHSRLCCSEKRSLSVGLRGMSVNSVAGSATMRRRTGRVDRRKEPKAWAFGCRARRHRCADAGGWPSSKPSAVAAITLDPCRGWGRHPLARIRAQKEPVVSPVGAGTEYRSTRRVSCCLALSSGQGSRRPFIATLSGSSYPGIRTANNSAFPSTQRHAGDGHALQKAGACWVPRGREVGASTVVDTMGDEPTSYFGICRGLREVLRFALACRRFWTGRVPVQSG